MARFHELEVTDVRKTIRDAVVVTLQPVNGAAEAFDFRPGQYLTFCRAFDGEELRRSYSICAGQVGIKRLEGGAFSTFANEDLAPGERLEAMPPMGSFHTEIDPAAERHYLAFAGGSGITPILSILRTVLSREPKSTFTLVYANKAVNTIMFREELEDLKNEYLGRLNLIHVLTAAEQEIELFSGRVTEDKCAQLFESGFIDIDTVDTAFICGPEPMMLEIAGALRKAGLEDKDIKFELFASAQPGRAKRKAVSRQAARTANQTALAITIDGASRTVEMPKDTVILDAALAHDMDAPFACRAGVCSTCRCRVLEGEVEMVANHALEDHEVEKGYVLSCQSYPVTDRVTVDYDQ